MLVLSRKVGERIQIGPHITLIVLAVRGGKIRLGFEAPAEVPIDREEVYQRIEREVIYPNPAMDCGKPPAEKRTTTRRAG